MALSLRNIMLGARFALGVPAADEDGRQDGSGSRLPRFMLGGGGVDDAAQEGSGSRLRFMLGSSSSGHDSFAIGVRAAQRPAHLSERSPVADGADPESEAYHIQVRIAHARTARVDLRAPFSAPTSLTKRFDVGQQGVRGTGSHVS